MIRGPDEQVTSALLDCAVTDPHPILRALAVRSLKECVHEWEPALISKVLPCLVDLEPVVRKAAGTKKVKRKEKNNCGAQGSRHYKLNKTLKTQIYSEFI